MLSRSVIELAGVQLEKYAAKVPQYETLFPYWLRDRFAVIPTVYRQQKYMYDNHTHTCEDRIVSLEQPHVRPIQRGKCPNPTEFGQKPHISVVDSYIFLEQTSWSNFNEGGDLQAAAETPNAALVLTAFFPSWMKLLRPKRLSSSSP